MGTTELCCHAVRAGHAGWGGTDWAGGWWVRAYLGAVFSHGVVVEAGLRFELFPTVLALESVLQLHMHPCREMLTLGTSPPGAPGQPYLLTHVHVLLEPHEGLSGDHVAGGADGLPPFMDGPLPGLLRATCGAGPGPQGPVGAPGRPGCQAQDPRSTLSP